MDQTFEKRKKVIFDFISDDFYVPMKIKEIAAVLQIPREQRDELKGVNTRSSVGKDHSFEEGEIQQRARGTAEGLIPG